MNLSGIVDCPKGELPIIELFPFCLFNNDFSVIL